MSSFMMRRCSESQAQAHHRSNLPSSHRDIVDNQSSGRNLADLSIEGDWDSRGTVNKIQCIRVIMRMRSGLYIHAVNTPGETQVNSRTLGFGSLAKKIGSLNE